jgi:hypothetical protein
MHSHPTTPEDTRPEMSRQEASWHETIAAMRARKAADAAGVMPEARLGLALAAQDPQVPVSDLPPITLGTLWAMEATEPHARALAATAYEDMALFIACVLHGEAVLLSALQQDWHGVRLAMLAAAAEPVARCKRIERHYESEMLALKSMTGGEVVQGKPQAPPAAWSATGPIPPAGA